MLDDSTIGRLYRQAHAERWALPLERFAEALAESIAAKPATAGDDRRYVATLHLEDLALACACAHASEPAWEHFMREHRPLLYRAADALDATGRAREVADSMYAELFGLRDGGERRSLLRYFHGRSSLATWLRAVLAQRYVDLSRSVRRFEPLHEEDEPAAAQTGLHANADRARCVTVVQEALGRAIGSLPARDRLRLACYYTKDMTLAATGRLLREHEATTSRRLAHTRTVLKDEVERYLRVEKQIGADEIARCLESLAQDAGPLDLSELLPDPAERKISARDRSIDREPL